MGTALEAVVLELGLLRDLVVEELAVHVKNTWAIRSVAIAGGTIVASWASWWSSTAEPSAAVWGQVAASSSWML